MSRLTRSEIETMFDDLILAHPIYTPQLRALREQSLSQEAVRDEALEALRELVELKDMKDRDVVFDGDRYQEYARRKPLAWAAARAAIDTALKSRA